jgi:hypothetical protein
MKKILITFLLLTFPTSALAQSLNACMDAWSQGFDQVDQRLLEVVERSTKQNQVNTSKLLDYLPGILRTYRCELKSVCHLASRPDLVKFLNDPESQEILQEYKKCEDLSCEEDFLKNLNLAAASTNSPNDLKFEYFGCKKRDLSEILATFPGSYESCGLTGYSREELYKLNDYCELHADYKIEQVRLILPRLMRKDANRKEMGFLSFKLYDLQRRLNVLISETNLFANIYTKIIDSMTCVLSECNCSQG